MRCERNRLIEAFNRQIRRIAAELADQVRQWTEQARNAIECIKRATNRHPKTTGPTPLAEALDERTRLLGRIGDRVTILSDRARDAWADEDRTWDMLEPYNRRALEAGPLRRRKANKALRDMADRLHENEFEQGPVTLERFEAMRKQAADAAREDAYRDPIMRELTDRYEQADRQVRELGGASRRLPDRLHDLTDKPRPATAPAPRLADVARQTREDAGQPARQPRRPVRKPEQQPERQEQQQDRPVGLAAAAKEAEEASKQLKRERQQEPKPEPALEWNPWDPADPMNLAMGGSQGYGLGL